MDDVNVWLLLVTFAMAIAWAWEMAEVMAIKTRQRYKEEARREGSMKRETLETINELLKEQREIKETLKYNEFGVAYEDFEYKQTWYNVKCSERMKELLIEALNRRLDEIKDELKELGLED